MLAIKQTLSKITKLFLHSIIVWSQILPRLHWRNEKYHNALDKARKRVNNGILCRGGKYLRYTEINESVPSLYRDGVHLANKGNDIFLRALTKGIHYFLYTDVKVYPNC